MSRIFINGIGAVSPAGWTMSALRDALAKGEISTARELSRPGHEKNLRVMPVPAPNPKPAFLAHPRLRRTSPISQYALAAVVEALGSVKLPVDPTNVGVIVCIFSGCVNYSRRFYDETLKNPSTASPLVFPETVFNAPASHISAYLQNNAINYTLVGDAGTFLLGLATGCQWIADGRVNDCILVGTEEIDWLTADAVRLFDKSKILSEGAGAVLLTSRQTGIELRAITNENLYVGSGKKPALDAMRNEMGQPSGRTLIVDSVSSANGISADENELWSNCSGDRLSVKKIVGEGLMAAAAWQTVHATDSLEHGDWEEAWVSIAGFHQQAIGAKFGKAG